MLINEKHNFRTSPKIYQMMKKYPTEGRFSERVHHFQIEPCPWSRNESRKSHRGVPKCHRFSRFKTILDSNEFSPFSSPDLSKMKKKQYFFTFSDVTLWVFGVGSPDSRWSKPRACAPWKIKNFSKNIFFEIEKYFFVRKKSPEPGFLIIIELIWKSRLGRFFQTKNIFFDFEKMFFQRFFFCFSWSTCSRLAPPWIWNSQLQKLTKLHPKMWKKTVFFHFGPDPWYPETRIVKMHSSAFSPFSPKWKKIHFFGFQDVTFRVLGVTRHSLQGRGANRTCSNCKFCDDTMKALFREKSAQKVSKKWVPRAGTVYGLIEILSCLFGILPDFNDFIYEEDLDVSTLHFPSTLSQGFCTYTHARTHARTFNLTAPDERNKRFAQWFHLWGETSLEDMSYEKITFSWKNVFFSCRKNMCWENIFREVGNPIENRIPFFNGFSNFTKNISPENNYSTRKKKFFQEMLFFHRTYLLGLLHLKDEILNPKTRKVTSWKPKNVCFFHFVTRSLIFETRMVKMHSSSLVRALPRFLWTLAYHLKVSPPTVYLRIVPRKYTSSTCHDFLFLQVSKNSSQRRSRFQSNVCSVVFFHTKYFSSILQHLSFYNTAESNI